MPRWLQIFFLVYQCGSAVIMQTLAPAPLTGYVYLSIVLQSIVLFPLWLWIPFAVSVYAVWSGLLAIATMNALTWLQGNLALAFPATCAIIAASSFPASESCITASAVNDLLTEPSMNGVCGVTARPVGSATP